MTAVLVAQTRAFFLLHPVAPASPLIVAVSGGPDSMALLDVLHTLQPAFGWPLVIAHLNHGLRAADSTADAALVAARAAELGVPCVIEQLPDQALGERASEQAARRARYQFLARVAVAHGARHVVMAHHADDQAETVLLRLMRGAGPHGLAAMRPVSPLPESHGTALLLRPLLAVPRAAILAHCAAQALHMRHDASNDDLRFQRNRVRHTLLPLLRRENPQIVAALGRTASLSADAAELLDTLLSPVWAAAQIDDQSVTIAGAAWAALDPVLQRALLRRAHAHIAPDAMLGFDHVETARALAGGGVGAVSELPGGVRIEIGYNGDITIGQRAIAAPQLVHDPQPITSGLPVVLAEGWRFGITAAAPPDAALTVTLDAAQLAGALTLRGRRAGERVRLAHAPGTRRVQDLFVDARIARTLRAAWPILCCDDQIVWIAGQRPAAAYAVTRDTTATCVAWVAAPETPEAHDL